MKKLKLLEEVYDKLNEFVIEKAENGENIIDGPSKPLLQGRGADRGQPHAPADEREV